MNKEIVRRTASIYFILLILVVPSYLIALNTFQGAPNQHYDNFINKNNRSTNQMDDNTFSNELQRINANSNINSKISPQIYQYFTKEIENNNPIQVFIETDIAISSKQIQQQFSFIEIIKTYENLPLTLVRVNPSKLETLANSYTIKSIHPNRVLKVEQTNQREILLDLLGNRVIKSDETTSNDLDNWWLGAIGANETNLTGKGVKVAILDTGVSIHPDLVGEGAYTSENEFYIKGTESRLTLNVNFANETDPSATGFAYDTYGHGSHCAGIVAGNGKLSDGTLRGVAPAAEIYNIRVVNSTGEAEDSWIIDGINFLVDSDVNIISISLGGYEPLESGAEEIAIATVVNAGKIVFASAGNEGPGYYSQSAPATYPYAISVGATNKKSVSAFSSVGPTWNDRIFPDIVAPGVDILSLNSIRGDMMSEAKLLDTLYHKKGYFGYILASGTSMSCPMSAGMAALVLEQYPTINPFALRVAIMKGATPINGYYPQGIDKSQGVGLINLPSTLSYINNSIPSESTDPNQMAAVIYNKLPYEPKNLIQKAGDEESFNYTLISGYAGAFTIEKVGLSGLEIELDKTSIVLDTPGLGYIGVRVKIPENASAGSYNGKIQIKSGANLVDTIEVSITVVNPIASIYFDTFHNIYDSVSLSGYSMPYFHQTFTSLVNMNFSIDFNSIYYGNTYGVTRDAELLHEGLMNYDILVLMNPTYPFTPYEIENIKNFYNKGGNILITAGMHTMAAIDSINTLLNELDSGISFSNTMSIAKPVDYFSEMHYAFMIEDVEKDHPIFNGVSTFITGPGALLEVEYANQTLANASEYCIAAYKDRTEEGKGKIVAFNDQIFLSNSFRSYTDDEIYLNDRLTENVFKYLAPNNTIGINIIESRLNHTTTQGNFTISVLNRTSNTGMTGLGSNQLNATLFNNGNEIDTLTIIEKGGGNYFIESIPITENMSSPYPYVMTINFTLGVENRIKNYSFFYYNSSNLFSFVNGTVTNGPIIRNQTSAAYIQFNSTLPSVSDANLTVYGNYMASSMFSRKSSVSFSEVASKNISDNYYHIKPQPLNTTPSGFLYFYGVMEKDDYILLTPDRWMARIPNEIPLFYNNSKFSGFGVTQLLQAGIATLSISSSTTEFFVDLYDLEDGVENLPGMRVTISFIPIGIIDGYYYPVFAAEEIYYELPYNFEKEGFYEEITIPRNITITEFGIERNISMYNNPKLFYLVSVSVRDLDGGSNGFLYVILFGDMYDSIGDYGPLVFSSIAIIGIVIVCIILEKNRKKRELGFGYNTYPNSEIRSF